MILTGSQRNQQRSTATGWTLQTKQAGRGSAWGVGTSFWNLHHSASVRQGVPEACRATRIECLGEAGKRQPVTTVFFDFGRCSALWVGCGRARGAESLGPNSMFSQCFLESKCHCKREFSNCIFFTVLQRVLSIYIAQAKQAHTQQKTTCFAWTRGMSPCMSFFLETPSSLGIR